MRLVRPVVAGIVAGAVAGFVVALLRPRTVHRAPWADDQPLVPAPLPERDTDIELTAPVQVRR